MLQHARQLLPQLHRKWLYWACGVALVCGLLTPAALSREARHQLAISFVRQPDGYTALYFPQENPVSFHQDPRTDVAEVRFAIGNHEGVYIIYRYHLTALDASRRYVGATTSTVQVADGQTVIVSALVPVPRLSGLVIKTVSVTLDGRIEHLSYILPSVGYGK